MANGPFEKFAVLVLTPLLTTPGPTAERLVLRDHVPPDAARLNLQPLAAGSLEPGNFDHIKTDENPSG